jgi:DNA-binding response OmpR family regulator
MRILLAEDDAAIGHVIRRGLTAAGHVVEHAVDGQAALDLALASRFDLVILDLMLPSRNGWSICEEMRAHEDDCPVLMLTACDSYDDRLRGFRAGADDYLTKPFHFQELLARIDAAGRRPARVVA